MSEAALSHPTYDELLEDNNRLRARNAELERSLTNLYQQLEQLKRHVFGRRSERHREDGLTLPLFAQQLPSEAESESDEIVVGAHTRSRRNGRKPLPKELPRERVEYHPEERNCAECGRELFPIGEDISEELEFIPAKLFVREHARIKYACKCGCGVVTASLPADVQIIEKGRPGAGLIAHLAVSKFVDHLPLNRQEQMFLRLGIKLSRQTMCDWLGAAAELLTPIYNELCRQLKACNYLRADETTLDVQDENKPGFTHRGYFWGYFSALKIVVFRYEESRSGQHPLCFLGDDYKGVLQTNAYDGYNEFFAKSGAVRAGCWAHARRKFFDAKATDPERAKIMLGLISKLYHVEREAKDKKLTQDQLLLLRQTRSRELLCLIEQYLRAWQQQVLPKSPFGKAVAYTLGQWQELTAFINLPFVRLDNNAIEQQIRPIALGRHNWIFAGSHNGAKRAALFYSLLNTCKLNNVNPWQYLADVLRKVHTTPASRIAELTPMRWKPSTNTS